MERKDSFLDFQTSIILDVLTRLPPKTICQSKCVCKTFLSLILSPEFRTMHLSRSPESLLLHHHIQSHESQPSFTILDIENVKPDNEHHHLLSDPLIQFGLGEYCIPSTGELITVVDTVNGLICLNEAENGRVYVCNPAIRECITLIAEPDGQRTHSCVAAYGFGLGNVTSQYKVVRIFQERQQDLDPSSGRVSEAQIWTLGQGAWRKVSNVPYLNKCNLHGVFLNGNLHWWTNDDDDDESSSKFINCFDVEEELFKPFPSPPSELRKNSLGCLGVVRDQLWMCDNTSRSEIVVWVMKEYGEGLSWCKEIAIEKSPILPVGQCYEVVYPLKVFENGEILFAWQESFFFSYHPVTKTVNTVYICEPNFEAIIHHSSMVSLKKFVVDGIRDVPLQSEQR